MSPSSAPVSQQGGARIGFHPLRVRRVVRETAEATSFVLDVPGELTAAFAYEAGQFLTFRVRVGDHVHHRCYSMSSAPEVDDELQVTVKRVPGGVVSNWMIDRLRPGDVVEASVPAGVFRLSPADADDELVAFAAGSGITPVFSLLKAALATTGRRVRLSYANRDRDAVIFGAELDALAGRHPGRLVVAHHLDVEQGFVDAGAVRAFVGDAAGAEVYVCGPTPYMDIVEGALLAHGVGADRIHVERFTAAAPTVLPDGEVAGGDGAGVGQGAGDGGAPRITIELGGRTDTVDHRPGTTILQTARQLGMSPPYSCESGSCATCMAMVVEGTVSMHLNDVLTDDEVAEGWVLTCQSVPTSPSVHVVYEGS
jgi:3-ketosteroid 9alpha-monooxygenase subunit B